MRIIDIRKEMKSLYCPPSVEVVEVDVPPMTFLMIDGAGDPNTVPAYSAAVEALFAVSYAIKFMVKKGPLALDYGVMPLEGLWWMDDMTKFTTEDKSQWKWRAMIMQPDFVTAEMIGQAVDGVRKKKGFAALDILRAETFTEGRSAQIMHVGPFTEEGVTIERLHRYIDSRGRRTGRHHEIYLSDIRKADPAKWKTIIRQPFHSHE
jgi:hypothetical protein